ncbi:MAG: Asp-tRNA(Asn)/Glu-tRNA(Gln) amidotransferase subunit GatA, partial [Oscillospiraceae bacterium]|nr:Asp-tRNA(Asn)/Glu-tRNA(Gln) amidotransferase subunit GatA [Oscillospiraceae bacterium]
MKYTALETGRLIRFGEISVTEAVSSALHAAERENGKLNAFITICREKAMARAAEVQKQIVDGKRTSPLAGVPVAVKDNICTEGIRTTCASKMLENFVPFYSASAVEKLERAGAVIIGKLNMDEFAMGSLSETSYFGPVRN